jgi:arginase
MTTRPDVKIIGVPMDLGTHRLGVDMGPNALRYIGLIATMRQMGITVSDAGNLSVLTPESCRSGREDLKYLDEIARVSEELGKMTGQVLRDHQFPLILGGDHSIAIGSIAGMNSFYGDDFGVVWIDAHPDCNTPLTTTSGNIHGMPLAVALGDGEERLVNILSPGRKLKPENLVMVGTKDFDPPERKYVRDRNLQVFTMDDIEERGIKEPIKAIKANAKRLKGVFVSLDLDSIDVAYAPGVGIRSHGGLNYREIKFLCHAISQACPLLGMEIVEFNPLYDRDNQTADLVVELVLTLLGQEYGDYQRYQERHNFRASGGLSPA